MPFYGNIYVRYSKTIRIQRRLMGTQSVVLIKKSFGEMGALPKLSVNDSLELYIIEMSTLNATKCK